MGIVGMTTVFSQIVFGVIGGVLTLYAWYAAAKQNESSEEQEKKNLEQAKILKSIEENQKLITNQLQIGTTKINSIANIAALGSADIRNMVAEFNRRLREFGNAVELNMRTPNPTSRHGELQTEFRTKYWSEAIALRDDLMRRLGAIKPYPNDHRTVAIDYGMLAGVSPVFDAANHLEELARRLP